MYMFMIFSATVLSVFRGLRGQSGDTLRWRGRIFRLWSRACSRVIGMRMEIRGEPPPAPFFLVSNHLSYTDVLVLGSQVPCVFVAKSEIAGWPFIGTLCRGVATLFIDRESKRDILRVIARIERVMRAGIGVILFPEGTSTRGDTVGRFRPSLLETAARAGIPVSYATLSYRTPGDEPPAQLKVCWWGGMSFLGHFLELLTLPRFTATVAFGEKPIQASDRKELATRLQDAVTSQFQAVV